ncbi:MAG: adenylate/guanylate cyclase domain-containing protein [Oscillospiraceae bacterium]|nr:adenylate/guanylate cyclase domain-containing protein [Oscillospiraceae bacterium]
MKKSLKQLLIRLATCLLAAGALTAVAGLGALYTPDNAACDALYQRASPTDGQIVIIGMDQRATDALGPMPWNRSVLAEAIEYLNSDPENAPALIGVDVLFVGRSADPQADDYLAEVCAEGGNVVVACAAAFGDRLVEGEDFHMDTWAVVGWDEAFRDLTDVADQGHINAMEDKDGIIRHAMLYVNGPDGEVQSFSRVLYERYCEYVGEEAKPAPETDAHGFFYLPYTAEPGGYYEGDSVIDLLTGEVDSADFAGKIVLIGPYAAGMQDEYTTSITHAENMYGVEIQANAIDAYRRGFFPKEVPDSIQLAILFVICAAALWFFWDRKVLHAIPVWLAICAVWIGLCLLLYKGGFVLHVLWVPLAVTVLFIASVAANYIRAAREKRRVTNTFGHYIDPSVMKQLLEQGVDALELGGKMYDIAVLFVDIRGFTTMSENLDPPTVVEIINKYLTLTTECIMRYHGTLDKFVGDCTMAIWNAPLPQDDYVFLACCAAMDMVKYSKALGDELLEKYGRTVSFGVGVHVGPAVVGNIGAPKRMDYTAIGDTVNTSSRLESNAPAGTIYISRNVADILGDRAETTSLGGSVKLKGKAEGFEVLTLDSLKY